MLKHHQTKGVKKLKLTFSCVQTYKLPNQNQPLGEAIQLQILFFQKS